MKCRNFGTNGKCLRSVNTQVSVNDGELVRVPIRCTYNGDVQECLDSLIDMDIDLGWYLDTFGVWSNFVLGCIHLEGIEKFGIQQENLSRETSGKKKQKEKERT